MYPHSTESSKCNIKNEHMRSSVHEYVSTTGLV
jgi:hypothetical protein